MSTPLMTTYASLVSHFVTFLSVAIHTILYERLIYPSDSFLSARKYNFAVRQSRHPKVCRWITDAVAAVEAEMLKGIVSCVSVVIFEPVSCKPLERFVFDLRRFPIVPPGEVNTPLERENTKTEGSSAARALVDMEEQLRAVMSKIATCNSRLRPIATGCTFTICIELKEDADPPIGHPQPWIPSQPDLQRTTMERAQDGQSVPMKHGEAMGGQRTISLRAVDAGEMMFEMWIEEGKAKFDPSYTVQSSGEVSSSG